MTTVCFGQAPIYHFPFNGNMNSADNSVSLTSPNPQSYVSNGSSANSALYVNVANSNTDRAAAPTALLSLLPTGNAARTVVMRITAIPLQYSVIIFLSTERALGSSSTIRTFMAISLFQK